MQLIMNDEQIQTIEQVKQFILGSEALDFRGISVEERYQWIEAVLVRFKYYRLKRAEKGVIRRYIAYAGGKRRRDRSIPTPPPVNSYTLTGEVRQFVF